MRNGLVVLCEAGGPWLLDDGTRLVPKDLEDWSQLDSAFRAMLASLSL